MMIIQFTNKYDKQNVLMSKRRKQNVSSLVCSTFIHVRCYYVEKFHTSITNIHM